jgi:hypothetical protein
MTIDKQHILHDLNLKDSLRSSSNYSTPVMFSRDSSMETLSSFNVNFHSHNSTYTSEHSTNPSGILSPSDIPDSPPRGCDDDIDAIHQRSFIQPLNNTNSTGRTLIQRSEHFTDDDDHDVDSIRNYATSPPIVSYHDDDDDNDSIHSSLSSLTLPPPPSTSTDVLLSNINELRSQRHNLSVINEESVHEQNDRRNLSMNVSHATSDNEDAAAAATDDDEDDVHQSHHHQRQRQHHQHHHRPHHHEDDDDDHRGKQLLFDLIRQRLPHHHISLTSTSNSSSRTHNTDKHNKSKSSTSSSSSSSSCINDQVTIVDMILTFVSGKHTHTFYLDSPLDNARGLFDAGYFVA